MPQIFVSTVIDASIEQLWPKVRDFNTFPEWVPGILGSRIEGDKQSDAVGCVRVLKVSDGLVKEKLLALSDIDFCYTYNIMSAPFEIINFLATLKLTPISDLNRTFICWSATFDGPKENEAEMMRKIGSDVFQKGLDGLKAQFLPKS